MNELVRLGVPFGLLGVAALVGLVCHGLAIARRRPGGDTADYWARVVVLVSTVLGSLGLVSGALRLWPRLWNTGYHLHTDLVGR